MQVLHVNRYEKQKKMFRMYVFNYFILNTLYYYYSVFIMEIEFLDFLVP